jgi:signal transduction histidine kinase
MLLAFRKFFGLSAYDQIVLAAVLVSVFLACFILWFAGEQFTFVARPLGLSTGLSILAIFLIRSRRLRQARPASLEMLQVRLNAFGHGTLIHHYMNRLEFYAENLDAAADLPVIGRERLLDIVRGLLRSLNNEIPPILHYQYVNIFAMDLARRLETTWTKLKKALTRLRRNLQRGEKLEEANLPEIATLQHQLREQIRAIKKRFSVQHYTDIKTVISEFVRQSDHAGVRVLPALDLPRVHITAADLTFVLAELASNALHHTDGHPPQIDINLRHSFDELCIDVQDNGSGIPESLWEEISRAGYTTKKEGKGGFGLYHVRQRIEKYGGKIFVAASEVGKGTTMRICLKTEI